MELILKSLLPKVDIPPRASYIHTQSGAVHRQHLVLAKHCIIFSQQACIPARAEHAVNLIYMRYALK